MPMAEAAKWLSQLRRSNIHEIGCLEMLLGVVKAGLEAAYVEESVYYSAYGVANICFTERWKVSHRDLTP